MRGIVFKDIFTVMFMGWGPMGTLKTQVTSYNRTRSVDNRSKTNGGLILCF